MLLLAPVSKQHRTSLSTDMQETLRSDPDLLRRVSLTRSTIPAVTHVDYSARVQTVDERHGRYYRLLKAFHRKTGCPVVVNTSFNLSWEPIVLTPEEAYQTFMQSEMDTQVLEDCLLLKAEQPLGLHTWTRTDPQGQVREGVPEADGPWADPLTGEPLLVTRCEARNSVTGKTYPVEHGIPRLFVLPKSSDGDPDDVTEIVKSFYEETPFPNYDDVDNGRALLEKATEGSVA